MQTLIQILKSGYGYDHTKEDGTIERVLVPPNKYMITAARTLEHLERSLDTQARILEQERDLNTQLYAECAKYRKTIQELENAANRTSNGNASTSTDNSTCEV